MLYSWDEIKKIGDCVEFCRTQLGMTPSGSSGEGVRYKAVPWRSGSDSNAFCVSSSGWIDHTTKEKGSILDLCARTMFHGDIMEAQKFLGELYGLTPVKLKKRRRVAIIYDYVDLDGVLLHQTVRWDPKDFTQRRPHPTKENKWINDLKGVEPVLYRIQEWYESPVVCIVGGEKDVNNLWEVGLPATTNAMGEGHWRNSYNESFRDKCVVVIPDNDAVGRKHCDVVCKALKGIAKQLKILELPGLPPKGDVSDYLSTHTREDLLAELKNAVEYGVENVTDDLGLDETSEEVEELPEVSTVIAETNVGDIVSDAKKANETAFSNFEYTTDESPTGIKKKMKIARHINIMRDDMYRRFWGFPKCVGQTLFDHDRVKKTIRFIENPSALFAWIAEKSGHNIEWMSRISGTCSQVQFFESVCANSDTYEMISGVPTYPKRNDVYYTHGEMPAPTHDAKYFNTFCNFFSPSSAADRDLLRVAVASPLYYRYGVDRPMWVVDATSGQGTGKTKFVEMIASLYGGDDLGSSESIRVDFKQMNNETMLDRIHKRLLSRTGRKKRIVLIDNIEGQFRSPALAALASQSAVSGIAPYGRGEETRPNDVTYFLTMNSASVGPDVNSRSFLLYLSPPSKKMEQWELKVHSYIAKYRLNIVSDIQGIFERGSSMDLRPVYKRFDCWESEVMMPVIGDVNRYDEVFKMVSERRTSADADLEEIEILKEYFKEQIRKLVGNPDVVSVWIHGQVLSIWCGKAIESFGGRSNRAAVRVLRTMSRSGKFSELDGTLNVYPHHGEIRRRGMMWNMDAHSLNPQYTKIIGIRNEEIQSFGTENEATLAAEEFDYNDNRTA